MVNQQQLHTRQLKTSNKTHETEYNVYKRKNTEGGISKKFV